MLVDHQESHSYEYSLNLVKYLLHVLLPLGKTKQAGRAKGKTMTYQDISKETEIQHTGIAKVALEQHLLILFVVSVFKHLVWTEFNGNCHIYKG